MASFEDHREDETENDIQDLFEKCADLIASDPAFIFKLSLGRTNLNDTKAILSRMGKVVVNIGDGLTLLHLAAQFGNVEIAQYLVEEKCHPLEMRTAHGETPLDQAAWKGNIGVAMVLLKNGADLDCQTWHGKYSPLHRCAFYGHQRLAALFCMAGANQKLLDANGKTAYQVAVDEGNEGIAQVLKPLITASGEDMTGVMYATNNPKHPNFRPEGRAAIFTLYGIESSLSASAENDE